MEQLVFDSGLESYEIVDVSGKKLGVVSFNPRDLNFYSRAKKIYADIMNLLQEAQELADNMPDDAEEDDYPDFTEQIVEIDRKIKAKLDKLAGCPISKTVFGDTNCMSIARNGKHLCRNLLEMIAAHIEKKFEEQKEETEKMLAEYTEEYEHEEAGDSAAEVAG